MLTFERCVDRGQYCLTEVGHGLDAFHLETTATLLPNGDFELNTPSERAAKYVRQHHRSLVHSPSDWRVLQQVHAPDGSGRHALRSDRFRAHNNQGRRLRCEAVYRAPPQR